jgi:hypothetical protein
MLHPTAPPSTRARANPPQEFEEGGGSNRVLQLWQRSPYLTKRYFYATFALSVYAAVFNQNTWPKFLDLDWRAISHGQVWRLFSTFFHFGPLGLNCAISM